MPGENQSSGDTGVETRREAVRYSEPCGPTPESASKRLQAQRAQQGPCCREVCWSVRISNSRTAGLIEHNWQWAVDEIALKVIESRIPPPVQNLTTSEN